MTQVTHMTQMTQVTQMTQMTHMTQMTQTTQGTSRFVQWMNCTGLELRLGNANESSRDTAF
jgi:hypothetical protein